MASLRDSYASFLFKDINYSSRFVLSHNLDWKNPLPAKNGIARDYRGLAQLMGFTFTDIKRFERHNEPTMVILDNWQSRQDATLDKLFSFLEEMERYDILDELLPVLEKDIKSQKERKLQNIPVHEITLKDYNSDYNSDYNTQGENSQVITCEDVETGECTYYDAYVCYAEDDTEFVEELARHLEPPGNQFKLCIHGRDMLPGCVDIESKINLIKQRCRLMLIILSPNFLKSSACAFQASFAASLAIEQRKRMIITLIIKDCEIPPVLHYLSHLNIVKPHGKQWVWSRLVYSLCEARRRCNIPFEKPNSAAYESQTTSDEPTVTFPETMQYLSLSADNSIAAIEASTPVASVEVLNCDSANHASKNVPQHMKKKMFSNVRKRFGTSSASKASPSLFSGASSNTSGFHSQSDNEIENSSRYNVSST